MSGSDKKAREAGASPFQILNMQRSDDRARYTTQAERTVNPRALRNITGPSWSASSGPRQKFASIQTECPLSEAQQEPLSPSSGDFPALTPSHSQSTILSDRSTGLFGGLQEDPSLDETGSTSDLARRRGFSGTLSTSLASRSLNGADGPGLSAQNGLATQDGPEEHLLMFPKINEYNHLISYTAHAQYSQGIDPHDLAYLGQDAGRIQTLATYTSNQSQQGAAPWSGLALQYDEGQILPESINDQVLSFPFKHCFAQTSELSPFEVLSNSKTAPANPLPSDNFPPPYQTLHYRDQGQNDRETANNNLRAYQGNSSTGAHYAASPATSTTSMNSEVSKGGRQPGSHLPEEGRRSAKEVRDRGACFRCWSMKGKCTPGQSPCANCLRLTQSKGFRLWMTPCSFKRLEERCEYILPGESAAPSIGGSQLRNEAPLANQIGVSQMRAFLSQYLGANPRKFLLSLSIGFGEPWTFWAVELVPGIHQLHQMFGFHRQSAVEHPSALPYSLTSPPVVPLWVNPLLMQVNIDCWLDRMIGDSQTGWQRHWFPDSCQIWQLKILEGICRQYRCHEPPCDRAGALAYQTLRYALKMSVLSYVMGHAFLVPEEHVGVLFRHLENPHFKRAHPKMVSPRAANKFVKMMALPVMQLVTEKTLSGLHELLRACVPHSRIWDQTFAAVFLCLMVISSTQRALSQRAIIYAANNDSSYGRLDAIFDARTMDEELVVYMIGMFHDKFRTIKGFNPLSRIGSVGQQPCSRFAAYVKTMTDEYYQLPPNDDLSNIGAERLLARFMRPFLSRT